MRSRSRWAASITLALLATAVGCRDRDARRLVDEPQVAQGGSLRRALPAEPPHLLPVIDPPDPYAQFVGRYIYEGLAAFDPASGLPVPALAERLEMSPDGRTVRASIRRGVRFHDGSLLSPADVVASFQAVRDASSPTSVARAALADLEDVRTAGGDLVEVVWRRPTARAVRALADVPVVPAAVASAGLDRREARVGAPGTGPFRLREWRAGQWLRLSRHDAYWGGRPALAEVTIRFIREPSTQLAAFRRGDLDMVSVTPSAFDAGRETFERDRRIQILRHERMRYDLVRLNVQRPPLGDARMRRALDRIVDRHAMTRAFFHGVYPSIRGPLGPDLFAAAPAADLEGGRALLAEAGGPPDRPLVLRTVGGIAEIRQVAEALRDQLGRAGVRLSVVETDFATFRDDLDQGRFDLAYLGADAFYDDPWESWHSRGSSNYGRLSNAAVDALLDRARATVDGPQRDRLLGEVSAALRAEAPAFFLWRYGVIVLVDRRLQGLKPSTYTGLEDVRGWRWAPAGAGG